mmetsp:Transcript_14943/g.30980  ORF Transcript_14943/g.30980 Transcript_14943/m.30980 type:complete len:212 (+) Transcript_14943:629-1264(+)
MGSAGTFFLPGNTPDAVEPLDLVLVKPDELGIVFEEFFSHFNVPESDTVLVQIDDILRFPVVHKRSGIQSQSDVTGSLFDICPQKGVALEIVVELIQKRPQLCGAVELRKVNRFPDLGAFCDWFRRVNASSPLAVVLDVDGNEKATVGGPGFLRVFVYVGERVVDSINVSLLQMAPHGSIVDLPLVAGISAVLGDDTAHGRAENIIFVAHV